MTMYTTPIEQISDGNGDPIVGAKKFLFSVGTTTKKTIYSDSALTVARANPVLSDADGRFPQFFLDGLYDEEQQDNTGTATGYDGATLWGPIPVGEVAEGAFTLWATDNTYDIPEIVLGSNDEYYRSLIDSNTGNDPVSSAGSWEQLQFGRVWNTNITYAKNDTVYGDDGFLYISTVAANVAKSPPLNSTHWKPATNQNQACIGAGAVDAITATLPIPLQSLNDETMVTVRALGANVTTTPTFAPDGLTAKTITKNGNQALVAGDIFGAGHELQLKFNSSNDVWELLNPADDINVVGNVLNSTVEVNVNDNILEDNSGGLANITPITSSATDLVVLSSITVTTGDIIFVQGYSTGTKGATAGGLELKAIKSSGTATVGAYLSASALDHVTGGASYIGVSQATTGILSGWLEVLTGGSLALKMVGISYGSDFTGGTQRFQAMTLRG